MASRRDNPQGTRADRLQRAVESARADAPTSGTRAKSPPRAIQFPKETGALRQHVADAQARQQPATFRLRMPAAEIEVPRPRPSAELRERVEQARRPPRAETANAAELRSQAAGPQLGTAADIGRLVRERRHLAGMSQGQLALVAGTGRRFISELEAGKPTVELERVLAVFKVLGVGLVAEQRPA